MERKNVLIGVYVGKSNSAKKGYLYEDYFLRAVVLPHV